MSTARITTREQLTQLATQLGVRSNWHEPDEQNVTASVHGISLGTAGYWPLSEATLFTKPQEQSELPNYGIPDPQPTPPHAELYVTVHQDGEPVADINLALLLEWASGSVENA